METGEGHGRGQVQKGPRSPGRPAFVVPQTTEGCDLHPQCSCDEQRKSAGSAQPQKTFPVSVIYKISITSFSRVPELPCIGLKMFETLLIYV